jgi:hypothetical protein
MDTDFVLKSNVIPAHAGMTLTKSVSIPCRAAASVFIRDPLGATPLSPKKDAPPAGEKKIEIEHN